MNTFFKVLVPTLILSSFVGISMADEKEKVSDVLNAFHEAASRHDGEKYFDLLTDDAIFLGTDGSERWDKATFRTWVDPYFKSGKGWTYVMTSRNIYLSDDKRMAWFDETLANEKYGNCRGTGILRMRNGKWKIAQYNLMIPVPNKIVNVLLEMIKVIAP